MMTHSTRDALIARLGLRPLAGATRVTDAQLQQALAAEAHAALQPYQAAAHQAWLQAERAREERGRRRFERTRAANEAVDEYMRTSGTTNYQAAFDHIQRTRPELFVAEPVPAPAALAGNFNPNHDRLGKFTTSEDAVSPHGRQHRPGVGVDSSTSAAFSQTPHLDYVGQPTQQKRGEAKDEPVSKEPVGSIRDYPSEKATNATCVAAAICTIIATMTRKGMPKLDDIKAQLEAAAQKVPKTGDVRFDWRGNGMSANATDYAVIVQKVLSDNGIKSTNNLGRDAKGKPVVNVPTMQALADTLVAKGTPAIVTIGDHPLNQHAVTMQWEPSRKADEEGQFLVNNIVAQGGTNSYTRKQFESGALRFDDLGSMGNRQSGFIPINRKYTIIFTAKP